MPYNLLLLPLIGGFLFLHITHFFRFGAQRLDGYRLLFQSAIAGLLLSALARFAVVLLNITPLAPVLNRCWTLFSPIEYSGTGALALLLGPLMALLANLLLNKNRSYDIEIQRHGNSLLRLLNYALKNKILMSITLDSRKWYIGWVAQAPNLDPQELYFQILPYISGYRDKDTLITRRAIFYQDVLDVPEIDQRRLFVTIPLKDVKLASLFDEELYSAFFAEQGHDEILPADPDDTPVRDETQED